MKRGGFLLQKLKKFDCFFSINICLVSRTHFADYIVVPAQVCTILNQVRWAGGYGDVSRVLHEAGRSVAPTLFSHADVQGDILEGLVVFIGECNSYLHIYATLFYPFLVCFFDQSISNQSVDIEANLLNELCAAADSYSSKFQSHRQTLVSALKSLGDDLMASRPRTSEEEEKISKSFMRWEELRTVKSASLLPVLQGLQSPYGKTFSQIQQK
jgi:hypothetical protein